MVLQSKEAIDGDQWKTFGSMIREKARLRMNQKRKNLKMIGEQYKNGKYKRYLTAIKKKYKQNKYKKQAFKGK